MSKTSKQPPRRFSAESDDVGRRWMMSPNKSKTPLRITRSEEDEPATKTPRRRRRVKRAHTMDNMATNIDENDEGVWTDNLSSTINDLGSPILSSPKSGNHKVSILQRFLHMNRVSWTKSKASISGEGSTVTRMTDDEPDLELSSPPGPPSSKRQSKSPTPPAPLVAGSNGSPAAAGEKGGGIGGFIRRFSEDSILRRRGSRDSSILEPDEAEREGCDYDVMQMEMQAKADDFHKQGLLDEAISTWLQCLALADEHQDSLAKKTEFRCILVDLHLLCATRYGCDDGEHTAAAFADAEAAVLHHRQSAERYLNRIKPALVKPSYWSCSKELFDFLLEKECWDLALLVAVRLVEQLGEFWPGPEQFATVHFQIASQKLGSNRQGEALHHLQATVKCMQMIAADERDMNMYLQVLDLIASEYNAQGQSELALGAYEESLKCAPIEKHTSLYCRMAHVHIVSKRPDDALQLLEAAASYLDHAEPSIRLELLQTKGDVYYRIGLMNESLTAYQSALEEVVDPAEKAKLLYTLGRLCVRLKQVRQAISYFTQEMEITEEELGCQHLSVSRILHELARLYDEGLGEPKMALMKLRKALEVELAALHECHYAITKCPKCNQVTFRMCPHHAAQQRDISSQIRETKKAQGRIHFKLGDFERALQTSFDGTERRGNCHRRKSALR